MSGRSITALVNGTVLSMVLVLAGCGSGSGGDSAEFTFKVADSFPKSHVIAKNLPVKYMKAVEKASKGRIDFEYFPAEQLGKAEDMAEMVKGGVADIAYIAPQYYSEKMPLGGIAGLPGVYEDSVSGAPAFYELMRGKLYQEEIKKNKLNPLLSFVTGAYQVATAEKKVSSTADMKGLRVRTSGGHMELTAKELNAVPVSLAAPEMYQAVERKTVDSLFISAESMKPYGLDKVVKYCTTNLSLGGFGAYYAINQDKWAELPEDLQKIMIEEGKKVSLAGGRALEADKQKQLKAFEKDGMELTEVSEAEAAKFDEVSDTVRQAWVKDMEKRGLPGKDILAEMKKLTSEQ
ncbi:MAG: hypothetical protein GEV07_23625 [Streptosporangiales bacterium]|nr:hypothetical protein [Streptosporangiales bacterium]